MPRNTIFLGKKLGGNHRIHHKSMEFVGFDDWFNLLFPNKIIGIIKFYNNGI